MKKSNKDITHIFKEQMALQSAIEFINNFDNDNSEKSIKNMEIELKVILDRRIQIPYFINQEIYSSDDIRKLITHSMKIGNVVEEQSINFIHTFKEGGMYVKQLIFNNGIQDKSKKNYYTKKSMVKPMYLTSNLTLPTYKLGINMETVVVADDNLDFDMVRFRNRMCISFPKYPRWRLDITYIKECKIYSMELLAKTRDIVFAKTLVELDWDYASKIEVEFEFIPDKFCHKNVDKFTIGDIKTVDEICQIIAPKTIVKSYTDCICEVATVIKPKFMHKFKNGQFGLKQLGANPVELTKNQYRLDIIPNIQNYIITEKIDGIRSIVLMYPSIGECYIINNKNKNGIRKLNIVVDDTYDIIILDSEEVDGEFYVFDILYTQTHQNDRNEKKHLHELKFINRKLHMDNIIDAYDFLQHKHYVELSKELYHVQIKEFYDTMLECKYKIDGLIIFEKHKSYNTMMQYKWKPIMTIDFVAKKCPSSLLGIHPYVKKENKTLYLLFCGMRNGDFHKVGVPLLKEYNIIFRNIECGMYKKKAYVKEQYFPIQFAPSIDPYAYLFWSDNSELDGLIVELTHTTEWELVKIRKDRMSDMARKTYYGNYFKYAEFIWMSLKYPLKMCDLCNTTTLKAYFQKDSKDYVSMRKFNNFVKLYIIRQCAEKCDLRNCVIDLASGKGQDLDKYIKCKFENILMIDNDYDALSEIVNRKYTSIDGKYTSIDGKLPSIDTSIIHINKCDLSQPYKKILLNIKAPSYNIPDRAPLVVCNLALHYLIADKQKMRNFCHLLYNLLEKGGYFIFTAFNGQKIFDLLKETDDNSGRKDWVKSKSLIYSLKKKYNTGEFTGINQQIDVLLPFSEGEYYTENLINIDMLNSMLAKKKINLIQSDSFISFDGIFEKDKEFFHKRLTKMDKEYISLYQYYIYQKI
jgi:hypothetical protein